MENYNIDKHLNKQKRDELVWMFIFILKGSIIGLLTCALLSM